MLGSKRVLAGRGLTLVYWSAAGEEGSSGPRAVVPEGVYARYLLHRTVGEGFEHEGLAVPTRVARAHQILDADD